MRPGKEGGLVSFRIVNGNTHTEKGWRCCNRDECDIVRIPGLYLTDTAPIRKGAPLTILGAWLYWYDRNVEEIVTPIWGWSLNNDVLGQPGKNNGSNHLSGVAVDVNAPKYPWGTYRMSADKIAKVEEGLRLFEGTVFWGRRWSKPDEMHYDLSYPEGDPRNEAFAKKLLDGYLGIYKPATQVSAAHILAAATGLSEARAAEILPAVRSGLRESECTNVNRIAMWLAQIGHESGSFQYTEEIAKNGRYAPYIGRTWIQITWDYNYRSFSQWAYAFGMVPTPDYFVVNYRELADLKWAGIGPAWYWTVARPDINELSDRRDLNTVTRRINGGTNGLADRQARYNRALAQGDALLQLLHEEDDFLSALTDAEQRELLDLARQQAKYKRKSRSPLHWPHEGEVDTIAGLSWSTDANVHIQLVEKLAVIYGDPVSIALLYAVSNSDDPTNNPELAKRILKRVKPEDITAAQVQIQKWLAAEQKFHAS
ncbi:lysin A [Mycobacterium phage Monet]|nr:lysin A [Mycobacterium phage Monet]